MSESELPDPAGALDAATRLKSGTDHLQGSVTAAKDLVERTQAVAPLWGDDEAGRQYRARYVPTDELLKATKQITEVLDGLAKVSAVAVDTLVHADERSRQALPD
ncbi:hypothetical protein F4553_000928 [Allocatelliglobosispora scoriae]|uniref:WXG100 family type VII secretion target n=1 Tax=Allocatelliglobosispora scoriae TaxID=643052 RepID=A0A841BK47_9ACTN|nr:hypothetical protein [Allocatelliglobosispora scoriae]MBB5867549.1 hypothetical protein [Allocatelliglobosispora scoriae]